MPTLIERLDDVIHVPSIEMEKPRFRKGYLKVNKDGLFSGAHELSIARCVHVMQVNNLDGIALNS